MRHYTIQYLIAVFAVFDLIVILSNNIMKQLKNIKKNFLKKRDVILCMIIRHIM